jgi:hypothetical protein
MPVSPINVATQGLLNSPLAVAAVRGHLIIGDIPPIIAEARGGDSSKLRLLMPDEKLDRLLKREDEEILAIIISFMESLDE